MGKEIRIRRSVTRTSEGAIDMDAINPQYYKRGKVECIDALETATMGLEGIEAVCTANAIKYLWRWKEKNGAQDLNKAVWYINHMIKNIRNEERELS